MKKRVSSHPHARMDASPGDASKGSVARKEDHPSGDDTGLTIVPAAQFDALLDLLDDPPAVPDDLRREIAGRRWA